MQRVLFHSTVFGPIKSRRLGVSLGINLSPDDGKICSFDCLYCEAGFNAQGKGTTGFPSLRQVKEQLESKLALMKDRNEELDVITFSGNGEPTLHPEFPLIVEEVNRLRDKYFPDAKTSVLTNSTRLNDPRVVEALRKVDNPILKLDSAISETIKIIDRPADKDFTAERLIRRLKEFGEKAIIQTMLLRGEHDGFEIDNTTPAETEALIKAIVEINPAGVMLYSIDRATPAKNLRKVSAEEIENVARQLREHNINVLTA